MWLAGLRDFIGWAFFRSDLFLLLGRAFRFLLLGRAFRTDRSGQGCAVRRGEAYLDGEDRFEILGQPGKGVPFLA